MLTNETPDLLRLFTPDEHLATFIGNNLLNLAAGLTKHLVAMPLQHAATLILVDGVLEIDLAALEGRNDFLKFAQRVLETHFLDIGRQAGFRPI